MVEMHTDKGGAMLSLHRWLRKESEKKSQSNVMKGEFKAALVTQNQKASEDAISFICRDSMERIITKERKSTGDTSVLLTETLTIRNALIHAINSKYSNVIIESDSMIMI